MEVMAQHAMDADIGSAPADIPAVQDHELHQKAGD